MPRDRFLTGILIGIGILIAAALILFWVRDSQAGYRDDASPDGVLHNYFLALQRGDYERAYGYLAENEQAPDRRKPDRLRFEQSFLGTQREALLQTSVTILSVKVEESGTVALADLSTRRESGDIFERSRPERESALLVLQNGAWKISSAPYPYWDYNWPDPRR